MKFKVNNDEVFASTGGRPFDKNKPLIIFVHGSGLTHMTWVLQTRYFAFHGYSCLALDLPGHGLSGRKSLKSIEDMADWVSNVIDVVGYKEASLVGHSQGCLVTIECTARYPNKIKTLSLMGGAGAIPMNTDLLALAESGDPKAVDLMMDWAHGPAGHFGGHPVPGLYHINTGGMLAKSRTIKDTLAVDFRACDNYKNGFEAAKKIKIPTLSILATDDKMCPVKEGKKLADNNKTLKSNDDVNKSQSSNDSFPTAMHIAAYKLVVEKAIPSINDFYKSLLNKVKKFENNAKWHYWNDLSQDDEDKIIQELSSK